MNLKKSTSTILLLFIFMIGFISEIKGQEMTTKEVANRLVELCREGKNLQAIEELYSPNIVSNEMPWVEGLSVVTTGITDVKAKNNGWFGSFKEMPKATVSEPLIAENHFVVRMTFTATHKDGKPYFIEELCVYEVENGKIVRENFYYSK